MEQEIVDAHQQIQALQGEFPDHMKQLQIPEEPETSEASELQVSACLGQYTFNTQFFKNLKGG